MEAAVTQRSRMCMQTVTPAKSSTDPRRRWLDDPRRPRGPPGTGAVVAQVGGGGACREPAGRSRVKKAAAGRQADLGLERVLLCVAELR